MRCEKDGRVIESLTKLVKRHWSKSVENLIQVGKCLHQLRGLLDRQEYVTHLSQNFSMSEMQAHRLEKLYLKFNTKASIHILSSRPSVLYLLPTSVSPEKIEVLAKGGRIKVGNQFKKIEQLTVKDIQSLAVGKKKASDPCDVNDDELEIIKAKTAHRRLATLLEKLTDWGTELALFKANAIQIENRDLVKKYVGETIECLRRLERKL